MMRKLLLTPLLLALGLPLVLNAGEPDRQGLLDALAEGGKVIMMRHASTEEAEPAVSMHLSGDCDQEQNLSAAGRAEAEAISRTFKAHGIVVEKVYSSEYCRARDTARIAFGGGEAWAALNLAESMDESESAFLMMDVEERMGDFAGEGNMVMVTHRSNINTITFQQTEPANMVILQPDGLGNTEVLGILTVEDL